MSDRDIKCTECGEMLNTRDVVCPSCGSDEKTTCLNGSDGLNVGIRTQSRLKAKKKGVKRPVKESIHGDEKYNLTGEWVDKTRIIDRENDQYIEIVKDKKTNEIIHECIEPLSDHINHGSAKKKNNQDK